MVRKIEDIKEIEKRYLEKIKENTIKVKWQVIEHTPGYESFGYFNERTHSQDIVVADEFESKEDAEEWMSLHVADEGNKLFIIKKTLVRFYYEKWV